MGISWNFRVLPSRIWNSQARVAWRIGTAGMENWNAGVYPQAEASKSVSNCCLESGAPRLAEWCE